MNNTRFLFYNDWKAQMEMMTDEQVRRFIYNLINFSEGKEIELPTKLEQALWIGVLPSLKINQEKYEKIVEKNKRNGQLGGRPPKLDGNPPNQNPENPDGFSQNPKNPINDKREVITDNSKMITGNRKEIIDKGEMITGNSEQITDNRKMNNDKSKPIIDKKENENWEPENEKREKSYDFLGSMDSKYIPGTNIIKEEIPGFPYKSYLEKKLMLYPDWEKDSQQLDMDEFLSNVSKNDPNLVFDPEYVIAYKYYVSNGIL
jgi:hypothetical protein